MRITSSTRDAESKVETSAAAGSAAFRLNASVDKAVSDAAASNTRNFVRLKTNNLNILSIKASDERELMPHEKNQMFQILKRTRRRSIEALNDKGVFGSEVDSLANQRLKKGVNDRFKGLERQCRRMFEGV